MVDQFPLGAAVTGVLTLAGTLAGSFIQVSISKNLQRAQHVTDTRKREADERAARRTEMIELMGQAHRSLSKIQREFSKTTLDIIWRSGMTDKEYDMRYEEVRASIDELRLLAELRLPDIAGDVERMNQESSNFWFHFKNLLTLSQEGADYPAKVQPLSQAHKAADEISMHASRAKTHLIQTAKRREIQIS